jgi:hypothetical protein
MLYPSPANPGLGLTTLVLTLSALVIVFILIVLVESTALQLMGWGDLRRSLWGAVLMNLASLLLSIFFLAMAPKFGLPGIGVSWFLSTLIEWLVLQRLGPFPRGRSLLVSGVANVASYLILILPAYLMAPR